MFHHFEEVSYKNLFDTLFLCFSFDYLEILQGNKELYTIRGHKDANYQTTVYGNNEIVAILFRSDALIAHKGFKATFKITAGR